MHTYKVPYRARTYYAGENLKKQHRPFWPDLCLRKTGQGNNMIIVFNSFDFKITKCFPFALKHKAGGSKILRFKEAFSKSYIFGDGLV